MTLALPDFIDENVDYMSDAMTVKEINLMLKPLDMECTLIDGDSYIIRL